MGEAARGVTVDDEDGNLRAARLRAPVAVDQPLVLISQAQRSGGTLLLRLLDGSHECYVAPFQLRRIDEVAKLQSTDPARVWRTIYDPKLADRFRSGHRQVKHDVLRDQHVFSFMLDPDLQRAIYDARVGECKEPTTRELVDCYFTSYFNAWLDYANADPTRKRWVVGFEPGVARAKGIEQLTGDLYPDGRMISIVRDPWSWYASARRWEPRWRNRELAIDYWCRVGRGTLKWRKRTRPGFITLSFDDLLARTEETVRFVAAWLEVDDGPELLVPTFNGRPIGANTSFADVSTEVSTKPLERAGQELDEDDMRYVSEHAGPLYERLLKVVGEDRASLSAAG